MKRRSTSESYNPRKTKKQSIKDKERELRDKAALGRGKLSNERVRLQDTSTLKVYTLYRATWTGAKASPSGFVKYTIPDHLNECFELKKNITKLKIGTQLWDALEKSTYYIRAKRNGSKRNVHSSSLVNLRDETLLVSLSEETFQRQLKFEKSRPYTQILRNVKMYSQHAVLEPKTRGFLEKVCATLGGVQFRQWLDAVAPILTKPWFYNYLTDDIYIRLKRDFIDDEYNGHFARFSSDDPRGIVNFVFYNDPRNVIDWNPLTDPIPKHLDKEGYEWPGIDYYNRRFAD